MNNDPKPTVTEGEIYKLLKICLFLSFVQAQAQNISPNVFTNAMFRVGTIRFQNLLHLSNITVGEPTNS